MASAPSLVEWTSQVANFEIYDESKRFLGLASIDLPEIQFMTQTISGAGIAGEVEMPSRWITGSLSLTLHWRSVTTYTFHLAEQGAHDLTMYGAVNTYTSGDSSNAVTMSSASSVAAWSTSSVHEAPKTGAGSIRPMSVKITARCLPKKTTMGKFQPNELMDNETELEIINIKVTVDGSDVLELDKFNYTLKIYGVDYASDIKSALGLS